MAGDRQAETTVPSETREKHAQLAEQVVRTSELTRLRDEFGHARLRAGIYTAGQIDGRWTDAIEADFTAWLRQNIDRLPVARAQSEEIL